MTEFFNNYSSIVVFLHVFSATVWIGGMIAIRFAVHYSMQTIEDPKIKIGKTLENLKRFFNIVIPAILTLLVTAIIMIVNFKLEENLVMIKEIIWLIMSMIFIAIYIKRNIAQKAFNNNDISTAKNNLVPIATYLIPINIILGIIAIFLGVTLRGF